MAGAKATLILMVTRDRLKLLRLSLDALCRRTSDCHKILVIDNGSQLRVLSYLRRKLRRGWISRLITNPASTPQWQKGYAIAQASEALKQAPKFEYFVWVDSDVEVKKGWLKAAKSVLTQMPEVDICSVHNDGLQEGKHPTIEIKTLGDLRVRMKKSANGAVWVMRRNFFDLYGLPPVGEGSGPKGVEDIHYSNLSEARGKTIAVLDGLSTHHGYASSSRLGHKGG